DAHHEFFRGENCEQERHERSCGSGGQTGDVLERERDWSHFAYKGIAVAEIRERLDISSSQKLVGSDGIAEDPFLFEALYIALSEQTIVSQSLSSRSGHLGSEHQEWTENGKHEKDDKAADL